MRWDHPCMGESLSDLPSRTASPQSPGSANPRKSHFQVSRTRISKQLTHIDKLTLKKKLDWLGHLPQIFSMGFPTLHYPIIHSSTTMRTRWRELPRNLKEAGGGGIKKMTIIGSALSDETTLNISHIHLISMQNVSD